MGLISIDDACEKYGMNKKTIQSRKTAYFNAIGNNPEWYHVHNRRAYIDTNLFESMGKLERKVWLYATDKLWFIFDDLGFNSERLSEIMSEHFGEPIHTWKGFFYKYLFMIPPDIMNGLEKSMTIKFVQYGTRYIYDMIKSGELDELQFLHDRKITKIQY